MGRSEFHCVVVVLLWLLVLLIVVIAMFEYKYQKGRQSTYSYESMKDRRSFWDQVECCRLTGSTIKLITIRQHVITRGECGVRRSLVRNSTAALVRIRANLVGTYDSLLFSHLTRQLA